MAFEGLSDKLSSVFSRLKGHGKVTEADIKASMREVKLALLEADVNFRVVKDFVAKVSERCKGSEVLESLTPGQQVIKIVREELTALMGTENAKVDFSSKPPTVIMMVGLQGAGKTTTSGKLAALLRKQNGKRPLLVAGDVYRPAAIKQLETLGAQINVPVFSLGDKVSPVEIAKQGIDHAKQHGNDLVIIDTAGRLHIDEGLMQELTDIKEEVVPSEVLLVVDAMTGQDAVNVAESFNNQLDITGVVLTKLDGDTRGGAALSVRAVSGKPIKFACIGEKLSDIEPFYPDRMATRILGMGDVLTLIDKAQEAFDEKQAAEMEKRLRQSQFTLEDFLVQMNQLKKMGPMSQLVGMLPGMGNMKDVEIDDSRMGRIEAIILSMTPSERRNPSIINGSRKVRIANGCGMKVQDVNQLLRQFEQMQKMVKKMMGNKGMMKKMARGFKF
ncbi:MAG: signal recognition particle protein [Ruminococcaceae bacterium]|nr:signal recognition particle protein [Oscillospiraceae bacterium]